MTIDEDYQWQLLHGKDGTHGTTWSLKGAHEILNDGFDPILDQLSGQDLLKPMVYSEKQGEWDYSGMFTAVLRHGVCSTSKPHVTYATVVTRGLSGDGLSS